jgi:hypothetical protein
MVIDAPGISAPEGSAICPRRVAAAAGAVVTEEAAAAFVGACPYAEPAPFMLNAKAIKKREKSFSLGYTNPPMVSYE